MKQKTIVNRTYLSISSIYQLAEQQVAVNLLQKVAEEKAALIAERCEHSAKLNQTIEYWNEAITRAQHYQDQLSACKCWYPECKRNLQRCTRCKVAKYCTKLCQKAHWKAGHKTQCNSAG